MQPLIQIRVVQFDGTPAPDVRFSFRPADETEYQSLHGSYEPGSGVYSFVIDDYRPGLYVLRIEASAYPVIEKQVEFSDAGYSGEVFLVDDETECVKMGGRRVYFRREPLLLGVHIPGYDAFQVERERVLNSPVLKQYLLYAQQPRLIFAAPAAPTNEAESHAALRALLRAEFRDYLVTDQAIQTTGGRIEFLSRHISLELQQGVSWEVVQQQAGLETVRPVFSDPNVPSFYLLEVESDKPYAVLDVVHALLKSPLVEAAEPQKDGVKENAAQVLPGDLLRAWQWHLKILRLPEAWGALPAAVKFGSADLILAVHDGGIETTGGGTVMHPDLTGGVTGGSLTGYLGGLDSKVYYQYDFSPAPLNDMVANNDNFDPHGIAVSGLATAKSDGATGIVGVAPNVRLASFKFNASVLNAYVANHFQFISGLNPGWSSGGLYAGTEKFPTLFRTGGNAGPPAFIINCSHSQDLPADADLVAALRRVTLLGRKRRGVIIFAAAGNNDKDTRVASQWGNDLNVLKIAASTVNSNGLEMLAAYSAHSSTIDPGLDVCAPADSNWEPIHNPPKFYGVVTDAKVGTGGIAGTNVTQALIQGHPSLNDSTLMLPAADFPNFPDQTNVIIYDPANHETMEANRLVPPPAAAPANTVYLATTLDTDFPNGSRISRGADDYTDAFSGTSAATPMVSGVAALMLSANPSLTWAEVRQILRETAVPIALSYLGPNGSRDKRWVDSANQAVIDVDGLMHIPAGAPMRTITTVLNKGAKLIDVANTDAFQPRQAICIGAESKLSAPTPGLLANQITVDRGDDFEQNDIIHIGKLHETLIDRPEPAVAGGELQIRVADPDGFVVGDELNLGGQQVRLDKISYLHGGASTDARVLFKVKTIGGGPFAAAPLATSVRIADSQREGPFTITAKADKLLTLDKNVVKVHPVGRIVQKEGTEIAAVKSVVSANQIEVYPLTNDHPVTNAPPKLHITGGRIAFYSHGFGYGRVDAYEAVTAAINYTHDRDVMIRNFVGDDGVTNRATKPVHSPDLWVTNDTPTLEAGLDPIEPGPHQRPRVSVSAPVFVGTGLNDLSAQGIFSGAAVTNYIIEITTVGAIDKFTWCQEGTAASAAMDITAAPQDLDIGLNGFLFITFGAVTGHAVGDKWYIRSEKITDRHVHLRIRNRGKSPTFAASAFHGLMTTPVNLYRIFLCLSDGAPVIQYYPEAAAGLNDLSVVSDYNGPKDFITIKIKSTAGAKDTFVWAKGSDIFSPLPVAITGGAQALINNVNVEYVKIQFGALTGHTVNDTWVLRCYPDAQKFVNVDHFILSNPLVPFSLTANRPGTWLMDEQPFPVLAGKDDPGNNKFYSFPWHEDNRPPRNGFGVAPPTRPLRMFILGEVVPHDGKLIGDVADQNNNLSYREIIFARFGFKKSTVIEEIASHVGVDSVGTATDEDFIVQIVTDVSTFNAEAVKLEFVLTFINGTTETRVFEFNGGAWGFAGVDPLWCTMEASPKQADGVTNATDEQYYMTFGGALSVSSAHRSVKITPKIYSTVNATVVLAEETQTVAVMEQAELASGRYSGASPADLTPRSHFFTDHVGVLAQTDAIAYGPVVSGTATDKQNKFRVTSLFKAATDVPAYAIVDGIVMLQRVADLANPGTFLPNVVNLVIKPYKQAMLGFTPVKYFVYRNLRLDEFLKGGSAADEKLVRAEAGASLFIQGLWALHTAQNGAVPFEGLVLGYDPASQPGFAKIDKLFNRQDSSKQLPFVARGLNLGKFYTNGGNDEFGVEIILDEGRFQPDYDYVRKYKEVVIDVSALPAATDKDKFTLRLEREKILNYIDPAAFFGMHMSKNGWLQVDDGAGNKTKTPPVDIYNNVLTKFYTKNTLYIDIRNENGQSLNFSGGYDDGSGNALAVGDTAGSLAAQGYATDKWPLIIRTSASAANAQDYNLAFLRLRLDYNHKPILYLEHGRPDGPTTKDRFIAGEDLVAAAATETNILGFRFPNQDLGSGNRVGVAWMLKMDYMMRQEPELAVVASTSAFKSASLEAATTATPFYLNNLFGPVDGEPLWTVDAPVIGWVSSPGKKYIDGDGMEALGFEHVADRGVAFSQWTGAASTAGSVLFYAAAKDTFVNSNEKFVAPNGVTDGVSKRSSFFEEALLFDGYALNVDVIVDGSDEVLTMSLQTSAADSRPAEAMLLLGLTRNELETHLKPLTGFDPRSQRTVRLEEVPGSPFTDPGGQFFRKFKAGVSGLDDAGLAVEAFPVTDVFVYTADQKFFFTNAFTKAQPLPTTYTRNYEEHFGEEMRSGDVYEIAAISGADVTVTLVQPGEAPVDLTREIVPGDQVTIKSVAYNVLTVITATAANSGVLTLDSAPAGVVPATDRLYAPEKPLEDYFISKDRLGPLSGIDPMGTLVENFVTAVNNVTDDSNAPAAIETHINNYGPKILERARLICNHNGFSYPDDRILYWARIKMMVKMKSHPYLCKILRKRNELIRVFETLSRGYEAVSFSTVSGARKKVLITGFDPFGISSNRRRSNPSGAAVLALHGQDFSLGVVDIHVQTAIFPVRYLDFDHNPAPNEGTGVVEQVVERLINIAHPDYQAADRPDMIVTVSQGGGFEFWVDRFASRRRGGSPDNLNVVNNSFPDSVAGDQFYETTLPATKIVPANNISGIFKVFYNNFFWYQWSSHPSTLPLENSCYPVDYGEESKPRPGQPDSGSKKIEVSSHPQHALLRGLVPSALDNNSSPKKDEIIARRGSGGTYLSNESFYRVARLREAYAASLITGHYHVPKIQHESNGTGTTYSVVDNATTSTGDLNPDVLKQLIEEIRDALLRAFA